MLDLENNAEELSFNHDLLRLIVCPVSKGALIYDADKSELISKTAGLAYPVRSGIPVLLKEEAREL
jgi:uncharacterized protein YbaR (Trm112 family)